MTATRAGTRLGGRYRLTERLAFGGMGEVWAGVDEVLGRAVAVKILRPELARDDAFRRRFREEARTAGGLSHPGIAAVYDYGEGPPSDPAVPHRVDDDPLGLGSPRHGLPGYPGSGGSRYAGPAGSPGYGLPGAQDQHEPDWTSGNDVAYLVMELVPGKPLSAILSESGPLPPVRALELVAQAARALHAAHQRGVVHRDVKPANLMVTPEGRVKVTDFGIARPQDHEPLTATGQVMGTAHYLAPELARGHLATALSDVYALGVVAYECVAGRRPFEGDNQVAVATAHLSEEPPSLPPELPADVRRVIMTAMAKDPGSRFVTADAFAEVLDLVRFRILAGDPLPVWAVRGPVPGVGTGPVRVPPGPRTPGHGSPGTGTTAGVGGAAGFLAEVGATRPVPPGTTQNLGGPTGTAALPLGGRRASRTGGDGAGGPRPPRTIGPLLAAGVLVVVIAALVVGFTLLRNNGKPGDPGTSAPSHTIGSSEPVVPFSAPDNTTSSSHPSFGTSHHGTPTTNAPRTTKPTAPSSGTATTTHTTTTAATPPTTPATPPTTPSTTPSGSGTP